MGQLAEASSACQVIPHLSPAPPASLCLAAAPGELVDGCPGILLGQDLLDYSSPPTPPSLTPLLSPTYTLTQPMDFLSRGSWC